MDRLDFQIIIELGNLHELLIRLMFLDGTDELPRFTGRADDDPFAEFLDHRSRQARLTMEELQVGQGDELIEVA